jgi:hypothetical protein
LEKYIQMAKELNMVDAKIISPDDIYFDIRAILTGALQLILKSNTMP